MDIPSFTPNKLIVNNHEFDDSYALPWVNGEVTPSQDEYLYQRYVEILRLHDTEAGTNVPDVVLQRIVVDTLAKKIKQSRDTHVPFTLTVGLHDDFGAKQAAKFVETGNGGFEVSAFTRLGQLDMSDTRVGTAVANLMRDVSDMHESYTDSSRFKVVDIVDDPLQTSNGGFAIVTTKSSVATLRNAQRVVDVLSRHTGYADLSEMDEETRRAFKITARVHDFGLHTGHDKLITDAKKRVASLLVDPNSTDILPALGSVYLRNVRA